MILAIWLIRYRLFDLTDDPVVFLFVQLIFFHHQKECNEYGADRDKDHPCPKRQMLPGLYRPKGMVCAHQHFLFRHISLIDFDLHPGDLLTDDINSAEYEDQCGDTLVHAAGKLHRKGADSRNNTVMPLVEPILVILNGIINVYQKNQIIQTLEEENQKTDNIQNNDVPGQKIAISKETSVTYHQQDR